MIGAALTLCCIVIILAIMASTVTVITLPAPIIAGITDITQLIYGTRWWLPWGVVLMCIAWLIALYNMRFLMSLVNWVRDLIK